MVKLSERLDKLEKELEREELDRDELGKVIEEVQDCIYDIGVEIERIEDSIEELKKSL